MPRIGNEPASNEAVRLAALEGYGILDTAPEAEFDDIVSIAAEICAAPMALISLVDDQRQWFKAALGLNATETPRKVAFCAHAIQQQGIFLVEDASRDARFADNPLVTGDPNLRFYAGAPLVTAEGLSLGTLCVLDSQPRKLTHTQHLALQALGRQVMTQLELRKALATKIADEERTRLSEEKLRNAEEAGGIGVFSIDFASSTVQVTPEFCRLFGIAPCDSMPVSDGVALIHDEDWAALQRVNADIGQLPLEVEYRICRPADGAIRWIVRKGKLEYAADGTALRLTGVIQDVTERRLAQRAAIENAAQFETFAQSLPNHVWTARPDGLLDWFNERLCAYSGLTPAELHQNGWLQLLHPEEFDTVAERWTAALESRHIFESELRLRRRDGVFRWHLSRALPIFTPEGHVSRWVGTNTDIHEQKLLEVQSTRERDRITADRERIWNSTHDLMGTLSADGFLKSVNPAWHRLLGYSEAELLSRPFAQFVADEDRGRLAAVFKSLSQAQAVVNLEDRLVHSDGSHSLMQWSAEPVDGHFYIVGRNVTAQRSTEEALRQSQKMEVVGQLTGGIAHDFNNLLQGITGSLDLVRKRIAQGRLDELDRFINGAMTSANRASALTHRLLAFSRRQPLDPRLVEANPLVTSMEDLLQRTLGERIQLALVLAADLWLTKCDPNQLESAVLNLVINARDAMPNGGKLTIETRNTQRRQDSLRREAKAGPYVCISVTDTGTGMSGDTMSKAFEPFFTTKPLGQGTGLGLSMIYGFAQQSEGYAQINSELGRGTTVELYLPRHRGEADVDPPVPEFGDIHTAVFNETVLVVEDEPVVRGLIIDVLSDLGYLALEAADGPRGLDMLRGRQRIDLLVTDVGLPGLNGRQLADAGRLLRPHLKVLYMTGYAENAAMASGFLEPGMSMITKPFAMESLATKIREILES